MSKSKQEDFINFLSKVPFFTEVKEASLKHLCIGLKEESFGKNENIFKKGDEGDSMYVIVEGSVKIHENNYIFSTMQKGECFGEYALIDDEKRSAAVSTLERSTLLKIERDSFLKVIANDSGFSLGILTVLIKRHRDIDAI
ncbi:cyclic nucleotide-binding domain-containing protein [Winogradskyella sp. PG-2]|uniref:cyclic nucleotide-binding domain-containing protein n=1 Tax=Winogradskyella sp. PG-2 TaxID=754409 RepID=UPI0004586C8E|nr:cyclic nucleotide-binding domain-containing protein [Winogradskyella sp. PG-2]BAO75496.1 cAMP-binding proteins - catabolite gene activator and regulatory subunit of cAMP-dependent protein kinases [Winogradskyella sp. PG-2]